MLPTCRRRTASFELNRCESDRCALRHQTLSVRSTTPRPLETYKDDEALLLLDGRPVLPDEERPPLHLPPRQRLDRALHPLPRLEGRKPVRARGGSTRQEEGAGCGQSSHAGPFMPCFTYAHPLERPVSLWICTATDSTGDTVSSSVLRLSEVVLHARLPCRQSGGGTRGESGQGCATCVVCVGVSSPCKPRLLPANTHTAALTHLPQTPSCSSWSARGTPQQASLEKDPRRPPRLERAASPLRAMRLPRPPPIPVDMRG